jgi:predicted AlkP superfamily pyrophosphatase or phosphodiesterase
MTLVVFGIDALDPDLVDPDTHPNLCLEASKPIETIESDVGEPSTHELWPTIITGLPPQEHGLVLGDDGVAWGNPVLDWGSRVAGVVLPEAIQTRIGAWLLSNTDLDAFRTPASYYEDNGLETVFDGRSSTAIGVPNYVVETDAQDREHVLRQSMGDLFERDPDATGGHRSADPAAFYNDCLEMAMVRTARVRAALRAREYEFVFGYTSAVDLVGHVAYQSPGMQAAIYAAVDEFVGELRDDLSDEDELLLVSDHGLKEGVHTVPAMVAASDARLVEEIESVLDVRGAVERELDRVDHAPGGHDFEVTAGGDGEAVREQLEDLGYMD